MSGEPELVPAVLVGGDIPRRLSALEDHPDYHPIWSRCVHQVYLNGQPVADVLRFDCDEGWVEIRERDARGKPIQVSSAAGTFVAHRKVEGKVRVSFRVPEGMRV